MAKEDGLHFNTNKERCVRHLRNPNDGLNSLSSKASPEDYRYERLYRNLFNPNFYLLAWYNHSAVSEMYRSFKLSGEILLRKIKLLCGTEKMD